MDNFIDLKKREFQELHRRSLEDKEGYWSDFAEKLIWTKRWDQVCDLSDAPITKWFTGGEINACYNCLDRHINDGKADREALYFDSPVTKTRKTYTHQQIYDEVTRLAGLLDELGVKKGNLVMIYMPMIPEGTFAMLACCRIGAVHSCVPSGLPAKDLAVRIDHAKPKVILVGSAGYHANGWVDYKVIFDEARVKASHKPEAVLVWRRPEIAEVTMVEGRDTDWQSAVEKANPKLECVPVEANEPLFVVYTSGSTGEPKGIVHSVGGTCVQYLRNRYLKFGSGDEVYFLTTNLGWVASHVLLYQSLLSNTKLLVFEGDPLLTSDPNTLYRLVQDHKITRMYVRPGILKVLRKMDPVGTLAREYNLQSLKQLYGGGEKTDIATMEWAVKIFDTTLTVGYGQTEIGGCLSGSPDYSLAKSARRIIMSSTIIPGFDVVIMKSDNTIAEANESGRILIKRPLPPGCLASLLGDHEKCKTLYYGEYPGYFDTKDDGYFDDRGNLMLDGRADDIMKHASVYLSATAVEEIVMTHPEVIECVVISTPHLILKEVPVTLYVPNKGSKSDLNKISEEIIERLSNHFGEAVTFGKAVPVQELPKTRTGKIHRPSIRALAKGEKPQATGGVENPEVLEDVMSALKTDGYGCAP